MAAIAAGMIAITLSINCDIGTDMDMILSINVVIAAGVTAAMVIVE
jgi:hypothetical protein